MRVFVIVIPTNLVTNSFVFLSQESVFQQVGGLEMTIFFLFIGNRALLQRHAEVSRLL